MEGMSKESMMKQAQHVWTMLDEMAENDPKAYKSFIDKQKAEKNAFTAPPEPHMCVQARMMKPQNVAFYINFCSWKRIPEPANPEEPVRVAGSAIGQIGDDKGKAAATAVAFNEKILQEFGKDAANKNDQDTLIQIAMDFIEKQHSHVKLDRKYKILERTHKGNIKVVQDSLMQAFKSKEKEPEADVSEILKSFGALATDNPDKLLSELNKENDDTEGNQPSFGDKLRGVKLDTKPMKKGLIEEISGTSISLPKPKYEFVNENASEKLVLKIFLPGVHSVGDCELEISKDDVSLLVENRYELYLSLPKPICDAGATAKFIKKSSTLQLTMPIDQCTKT